MSSRFYRSSWIRRLLNLGDARCYYTRRRHKELVAFMEESPLLQLHSLLNSECISVEAGEVLVLELQRKLSTEDFCKKLVAAYASGRFR